MLGSTKLWCQYYVAGKAIRESTHETDPRKAEKFLHRRLGEIASGNFIGPNLERIRVSELAEDLERDYKINGRKSAEWASRRWTLHLKPFFGHLRTVNVTSAQIARYIDQRQREGAEPASINRELAFLKRAFRLGAQSTPPKVRVVPYIPMLRESNVRKGFLDGASYVRLASECAKVGLWLRAIFECGHTYGWRHEELVGLRVNQVDLFAGMIRLEPGETKNDDGREVSLTQKARDLLVQCIRGKGPDDLVFTRDKGEPLGDFRKSWANACAAAGVGELQCPQCMKPVVGKHCDGCDKDWPRRELKYHGLLFHDLRRTAVRNMVRAGVPQRVAMTITGHKTRAVFDRYHIVAPSDLAEASRKVEAAQALEQSANTLPNRHISDIVMPAHYPTGNLPN